MVYFATARVMGRSQETVTAELRIRGTMYVLYCKELVSKTGRRLS